MEFSTFVFGSVCYIALFLAVLFLDRRRLFAVGTVCGAVFFAMVVEGPLSLAFKILLGGFNGFCLSYLGSLAKQKLRPYLRPHLDPEAWTMETHVPAPSSAEAPELKSLRLTLANSAAAGASTAGLLSIWIGDIAGQEWHFGQLFDLLSAWLVTIAVVAWVGVSLFDLASGTPHVTDSVQKGTWIKVGLLGFLLAMFQETIGNMMEKGLQMRNGLGIWTLLVNSLAAGVATYYWTACAQLRDRSIARRAGSSSSLLGGLMLFPPMLILVLLAVPFWSSGGSTYKSEGMLFYFLLSILLAAAISWFYGILFLGLNAFLGGMAIRRGWAIPAALRVLIGLLPVAALNVAFMYGINALMSARGMLGNTPLPLVWQDWLHPFASALGWSLGLLSNPGFERVMAVYRTHEKQQKPEIVGTSIENLMRQN